MPDSLPPASPARPGPAAWLGQCNSQTQQFLSLAGRPDIISLGGGLPAPELYPVARIARAAATALDRWGSDALEYGPVEGFPALRDAIAERMTAATGAAFSRDNILLTTGAMQGLDLVGKVLLDPGDLIVAQFPTYLGALDAWRPRQPRYQKLNWAEDTALTAAKFVYAVPNYSNPTGALVPQSERIGLVRRGMAAGTWLLEDDPYLPLQLDGPAGPSLLAHAAAGSTGEYRGPVIYLGTLSKSLVPGLRVGWAVADPDMIRMLALAKQSTDLSGSMLTHAIALSLIESGVEAAQAAVTVPAYRERRDALLAAAAEWLGDWFAWDTPPGGMFVWLRATHPGIDTDALSALALEEGVAFVPSSVFDPDATMRSALRLNFSRNKPEILAEGIRRLARATRRLVG